MPKRQRIKIFLTGVKLNWPRKKAFVLLPVLKPAQKNQFKFLSHKQTTMNSTKYFYTIIILISSMISSGIVKGQGKEKLIDVDFPGGNIIVLNSSNKSTLYYTTEDTVILLRPDLRDSGQEWFYWFFRIRGAAGETVHFHFNSRKIGSFGPAYSINKGASWNWLHDELQISHERFSYTFGPDEDEVMFSSTIPYLEKDFNKFNSKYEHFTHFTRGVLTTSEKGREVDMINICPSNSEPKHKVLITARHHAGESLASYVLEGIVSSIMDDSSQMSDWLRENVEFLIIPFMDKDGVEDGDQGKGRMPHDHNQNYSKSEYKSVVALREKVKEWSEGDLKIALDLHCPGIAGNWHEHIYFVGSGSKALANEQRVFRDYLSRNQKGELIVDPEKSILEFGISWNKGNPLQGPTNFNRWAAQIAGATLSTSLETPFANNNGQKVTAHNARDFGNDIALAISKYLQDGSTCY